MERSSSSPAPRRASAARPRASSPRRGAKVALLAREGAGLEAAGRDVERAGAAGPGRCPSTSPTPTRSRRRPTGSSPSSATIDVWVNNAMATVFARVWDIEPDEFRRATEVTYLGARARDDGARCGGCARAIAA